MARGLLALVVPLLVCAAVGCQPTQAPPAVAPGLPTTPADPKAPSAERTLEYWEGISWAQYQAVARYSGCDNPQLEDVTALLVAAAKGVEELPAVGVDPDAIEVSHGVAESFRRLARFLQQSLSAANGVQTTIRLLFGDNGAFKELAADARDLRKYVEESAAKARKTRALLSSRYGREFPALDAPPKKPVGPSVAQQVADNFRLFRDLEQPTARQEVTRLKAEIATLDKELDTLRNDLAKELVSKDKLSRQFEEVRAAVDAETDARRKQMLTTTSDALANTLKAREESIGLLTKQLDTVREQKQQLQATAEELEVSVLSLDRSKFKPDDTKLTELREQIEKLNKMLDVEREKQRVTKPIANK